eukprot:195607_1
MLSTIRQHPMRCVLLAGVMMNIVYYIHLYHKIQMTETLNQIHDNPDFDGKADDGLKSSDAVNVYLIRHGKSTANLLKEQRNFDKSRSVADPNLCDEGWKQAIELGNILEISNFLENRNIGAIYSSLMRRAMQTTLAVFTRFDPK